MQLASSISVFLLFSLALTYPGGYAVGAVLLLILGLWTLARRRAQLDRKDWTLIALFLLYTAVCLGLNLVHGDPARRYDEPLRFVLAIPPLLFLRRVPPSPRALWSGVALGALAAGVLAVWQVTLGQHLRAGDAVNPIQYGNISIALGLLCIAGLAWAREQPASKGWRALLLAGALAGILASILTQSRGSWLALPLCVPVLAFCSPWRGSIKKWLLGLVLGLAAFGTLLAISPDSALQRRFTDIGKEVQAYRHSGKADNSVGGRLEMWRTSWIIFAERPVLGAGWTGYEQRKRELVRSGQADPYILEHSHAHNDFLDAMAKRGLPGLALTLALYLFPLWAFARMACQGPRPARPFALAGAMLAASWIGFGLTDTFLVHNNGALLYAFSVAILWGMARQAPQNQG